MVTAPVNNFSVMLGQSNNLKGIEHFYAEFMLIAQRHNLSYVVFKPHLLI